MKKWGNRVGFIVVLCFGEYEFSFYPELSLIWRFFFVIGDVEVRTSNASK